MAILSWVSKTLSRLLAFARRYRTGFAISVLVCLISMTLYSAPLFLSQRHIPLLEPLVGFLANVELKTLDMRFILRGQRKPGPAVVIVAIDQKSQDVLGRWPFPRSYFAQAVDYLRESQARVVAFDVNFPNLTRIPRFRHCKTCASTMTHSGSGDFRIRNLTLA